MDISVIYISLNNKTTDVDYWIIKINMSYPNNSALIVIDQFLSVKKQQVGSTST